MAKWFRKHPAHERYLQLKEAARERERIIAMPVHIYGNIAAKVLHCWNPDDHEDKIYAVWIEDRGGNIPYFVCAGNGARTKAGMLTVQPKGAFTIKSSAEQEVAKIVRDKMKKGYRDVETQSYLSIGDPNCPIVNFDEVINPQKVDTSRIIGYNPTTGSGVSASTPVVRPASRQVPKQTSKKQSGQVNTGRSRRSIDL